jgi:aminoglycoside phosphotransferase (APT) family kinase protein
MHSINITERSGTKLRIVVRRFNDYWAKNEPQVAPREFQILTPWKKPASPPLVLYGSTQTAIPSGTPTIVQTWLSGRANIAPTNLDTYLHRLAEALAQLHLANFDSSDTSHLKKKSLELAEDTKSEKLIARCLTHPAGEQILKTLDESFPTMSTPRLIHNDFWPGNRVWSRGNLTGIVDWEVPVLSEPAFDVAYCRMDLTFIFGSAAADQFRSHYETVSGVRLIAPHFWDLLVATQELPDPTCDAVFDSAHNTTGFIGRYHPDNGEFIRGSGPDIAIPNPGHPDNSSESRSNFFAEYEYTATTLSIWTDLESVAVFSYRGLHAEALSKRSEWFDQTDYPVYAASWLNDNDLPHCPLPPNPLPRSRPKPHSIRLQIPLRPHRHPHKTRSPNPQPVRKNRPIMAASNESVPDTWIR